MRWRWHCQLRGSSGDEITVVSIGPVSAEDTLRKALALKADRAYRVDDTDQAQPTPGIAAKVLAATCKHLGDFDLVMVGRESGDWGAGQTGGLLAEELGWPFVAFVDTVEKSDTGFQLRRQTDRGWEVVQARPPLVISITNNDQNVPRIPKTRDIMMAGRTTITTIEPAEFGLSASVFASPETEVVELEIPEKQMNCDFIEGNSMEEKIATLAERLAEAVR